MCLFPFGQENFQNLQPPNEKCIFFVKKLKILMFCSIAIGILIFFINPFSGLQILIMSLILYLAYSQLSYCACLIYFFLTFYLLVLNFSAIGLILQKKEGFFPGGKKSFNSFILLLSTIFYAISCHYCFQSYKEFKAVAIEQGGGVGGGLGLGRFAVPSQQNNNEHQQHYSYERFQDENDQQQQNQADQLQQNQLMPNPNQQQQQSASVYFQAFQGRGVQIG